MPVFTFIIYNRVLPHISTHLFLQDTEFRAEGTGILIIFMLCFTVQNPCSRQGQSKSMMAVGNAYISYIITVLKIHWYGCEIT